MLLSIIIPVYNGETFLENAIDSVIKQPCHNFEIIVVDDGSTDHSLEIAQRYEKEYNGLVKVVHTENHGVSHARNLGIEVAEGKYISFLDADDVICCGAYSHKLEEILTDEEYDLFSMSFIFGSNDLEHGSIQSVTDGRTIKDQNDTLRKYDPCKPHSSFLFRRKLLVANSELRYPEHIKRNEDFVFVYLVLQKIVSICELDIKWFVYRDNLKSISHREKTYEYIVAESIPAWNWCKRMCLDKKAKDGCDIRLFAVVVEYIQNSCSVGTPLQEIMQVLDNEMFKECLVNYEIFWGSKKKIYEDFITNPNKFWLKYRIKGIPKLLARNIVRLPFVRQYYYKMKYGTKIGNYLQ